MPSSGLDDGLPLRSTQPGATFPAGPPHGFFMDRLAAAFRAELAAFAELVAGERTSPCTVADALAGGVDRRGGDRLGPGASTR